jgi:deoxyribose-phosphate aldolase
MNLTAPDIARMLDLSAVRAPDDEERIRALAAAARRHRCILATALTSHIPLLVELLADEPDVGVGGNIAFPSGSGTTKMKLAEARELIAMGCDEPDLVMDVGLFRSGRIRKVEDEIRAIVDVADGRAVKVILECHWLTDEEIRTACELCLRARPAFVKTSTGWAPTGATLENVALIKSCVGDAIRIKASGGIRDLKTLMAMYRRGARRFGIGLGHEQGIFDEIAALPGGRVST